LSNVDVFLTLILAPTLPNNIFFKRKTIAYVKFAIQIKERLVVLENRDIMEIF
jgi:hypothetical protein